MEVPVDMTAGVDMTVEEVCTGLFRAAGWFSQHAGPFCSHGFPPPVAPLANCRAWPYRRITGPPYPVGCVSGRQAARIALGNGLTQHQHHARMHVRL